MKTKIWSIFGLAAFVITPLFAGAETHTVTFTASGYAGSEALENFPVLVRLAEYDVSAQIGILGFSYDDCQEGGTDVRFFIGETELAREIDTWNPNGESLVWVRVPSLTSSTTFTMTYGDGIASAATGDVWSRYVVVIHGGDAITNVVSGGVAASAGSASVAANADAGTIGGGIRKAAAKSIGINVANPSSALTESGKFSVSGWFKRNGNGGKNNGTHILGSSMSKWGASDGYVMLQEQGKYISVAKKGAHSWSSGTYTLADGVWGHFAFSYESEVALKSFFNGNPDQTTTSPGNLVNSIIGNWSFGSYANAASDDSFVGDMDELRIFNGVASPDWIAAEYETMANESFLTASTEVDAMAFWFDDDGVTPLSPAFTAVSGGTRPVRADPAKHSVFYDYAFQGWTPVGGDGTVYAASELPVQTTGTIASYKAVWQTTLSDRVRAPEGFARCVPFAVVGYDTSRSALTNFPVLVRISEAGIFRFDYDDLMFKSTGDDICFVTEDGTPLAFEIDTWNPLGESFVWVNLPRMTNGTEFAMFYRSSKKGKVDVCTANPFADYVGVWHLREGGDGQQSVYDSTDNALTALSSDRSLEVPVGKVGAARTVTTVREKADKGIKVQTTKGTEIAALNTLGTNFVVSFWMRPLRAISNADVADSMRYGVAIGRKSATTDQAWHLQLAVNSTDLRVWSNEKDTNKLTTTDPVLPLVKNEWTKIDVVYAYNNPTYPKTGTSDVGTYAVYANGAKVAGGNLQNIPAQGTSTLTIGGGFSGGERPLMADMDEVRVGPFTPSVDWVKADYDQAATTTFLAPGTVMEFEEAANPVASFSLADTGAAFARFSGSISVCGGDATACEILVKVWPSANAEPAEWETLVPSVGEGASFAGTLVDLVPQTVYSYKIKAVNNLAEPLDSDVETGTFTTSGAGEVGAGGDAKRVGDSMVHTFTIARNGTDTYEFVPPSYATSVEALVVGGGGAGGYRRGGGGGAGGLVYNEALGVTGGETYTVTVGVGGDASETADVYGGNGGDSSIVGEGVNVTAAGGGAGGNGELTGTGNLLSGHDGGSGGGASQDGTAGAGTSGQGNAGGVGLKKDNNAFYGGGGGGAMAAGGSVSTGNTVSAGKGGDGREYSISGVATFYAGGGGGGGTRSQDGASFGSPGDGGNGGGGRGGQRVDALDNTPDDTRAARNGVDGLGGGGGGGGDTTGFFQGGDGGNGVVIVRYAVQGTGTGMTDPAVALESLDRAANGVTTVGYRVAWAGDGYDYADVKVVWGFSKDDLSNTNAIASSAIGRGTGEFTLTDQTRTVYVRLLATNAVAGALSPEIETIPFVDPAAPEVEQPVVSSITSTGASFSAAVVGLGEGAASVQGVFQVCTEDDFEGTVLSFPAAQTVTEVPGSLTAKATGLSVNTLYYVRVSATNDVPAVFETEPIPFRTGVPGAPDCSVVTNLTTVANPPAECATPTATATTITAWGYLFTPGNNGATYADLRLEASTTEDFQTVDAYTAAETGVTQRGYRSFTLTDLQPETAYYLRLRSENDGRVVAYSAIVGPCTTKAPAGVIFLIY